MPRAPFEINGKQVAPGSRRTIDIPVSVLSDHTPISMSAQVIHGRRPGPVVFVSGGIHGDEVIGVEVIRRILAAKPLKTLQGTLIAVPVVNAFGLINQSRYLPDRRDLNRSFPGSETGSLAARLARRFLDEIVAKSDFGIDLHSAAVHRTNYPQVRVSPGDQEMADFAKIFGAPIIMTSALREGSLRHAAQELGKPVLLYEAGEALRFDENSARAGVTGVLRILRHFKMISGKGIRTPKVPPQFCHSSRWLRAPMGGLLRVFKDDGVLVQKGDVLATVSDPFGAQEKDIIAPKSGIIVGRAVMPIVNEGDAVFHLGHVQSISNTEDAVEHFEAQLEDDPMFLEEEII